MPRYGLAPASCGASHRRSGPRNPIAGRASVMTLLQTREMDVSRRTQMTPWPLLDQRFPQTTTPAPGAGNSSDAHIDGATTQRRRCPRQCPSSTAQGFPSLVALMSTNIARMETVTTSPLTHSSNRSRGRRGLVDPGSAGTGGDAMNSCWRVALTPGHTTLVRSDPGLLHRVKPTRAH